MFEQCDNLKKAGLSLILNVLMKFTMFKKNSFEKLPNKFGTNCFACGFENSKGLQMTFWKGTDSVISSLVLTKEFCGWNNLVHGGIITTILDEIMSWTTICLLDCLVVTKSISVEFKNPLYVGDKILAEGRIKEIPNKRTVITEATISNESKKVCSTGSAVFSRFSQKMGKKLGLVES